MSNGESGGLYYYLVYLERYNHSASKKEEIKTPHIYKANGVAWNNAELLAYLEKIKKSSGFTPNKVDFVKKNGFNYDIVESKDHLEIKKSLPSLFTVTRSFV